MIIAGAGGAAHLPGMTASLTPLPVIGVPVPLEELDGLDSLLSIVQMPNGIPVATVGVGKARNAALLAVRILGAHDDALRARMEEFQAGLADTVLEKDAKLRDRTAEGRAGSYAAVKSARASRRTRARPSAASAVRRRGHDRVGFACEVRLERLLEARVHEALRRRQRARRPLRQTRRERFAPRRARRRRARRSVIRPQSSASSALSTRLVSVSSSARRTPTRRGTNQLDEPSGVSPMPVYAITNFVDSPATTRSDAPTKPEPRARRAAVHRGHHRRVAAHEQR